MPTRPAYTLTELLVALVVAGVVTAMLAGVVTGFARSDGRLKAQAAADADIAAGLDAVARLISRAAPGGAVTGEANALAFDAVEPDYPALPGLYNYQLRVAGGRAGAVLNVLRTRDRGDPVEARAIAAAASIRFAYADSKGEWKESWAPADGAPALIRIEVAPALGRPWPALVVAWPYAQGADPGEGG